MQNFIFRNPVKIVFGRGVIAQTGKHVSEWGKKALFVYGRSSIKANGAYETITKSLKEAGVEMIEHGGVQPNPTLSHVKQGIETAREHNCGVILAAGGGSSIDTAKAIAAGVKAECDPWDFFTGKSSINGALPVVTALTLAAAGSEMNCGCVVTNEETMQKYSAISGHLFPKVSILDPETTFTVPASHTAYGAIDAMAHVMEGYFTSSDAETPVQDEIAEGLMRAVKTSAERILKNPKDYEARAAMMWASSLALNGLPAAGLGGISFINHAIEHSLSAIFDIPHGAGLAIIIPAWLKLQFASKGAGKYARFARKVMSVKSRDDNKAAALGIEALKKWFKKIGAPVCLESAGIKPLDISRIAANADETIRLWEIEGYPRETIVAILENASINCGAKKC